MMDHVVKDGLFSSGPNMTVSIVPKVEVESWLWNLWRGFAVELLLGADLAVMMCLVTIPGESRSGCSGPWPVQPSH